MWSRLNILRDEYPSYFTILLRKSRKVKIFETIIFVVFIFTFSLIYNFTDNMFKIGAIVGGILVLSFTPIIFKLVVKPRYTLTDTHLIIEKLGSKKEVSLTNIEQTYDLRFFFILDGKKTPLMVSDIFIEELNTQIEQLKRNKKNIKGVEPL